METLRKTFITAQPGKAVWTLLALGLNLVRFPLWLIYYLPRALRPNPQWTHRQAVRVQIIATFLWNVSIVEMKTPLSLAPGKEKEQFVTIQPSKKSLYTGVADKDPETKPQPIGSTWYPSPLKDKPSGYVVLHFHGGGFAIGDGRAHDAGFAAKTLIAQTDASHVFAPQYRLASNPDGRFPAPLQDAITSYAHLLDQLNIPASRIIVSGDSAGGNIVLALLRYVADEGNLPAPAAAWLWSPWVCPVISLEPGAIKRNPNNTTDYINEAFGAWGANSLRPAKSTGMSLADAYISPLGHPFATDTPVYVSTGECEVLYFDDVKFAEQMKGVSGNKVKLQVEEYAVHDIILVGKISGFVKEAERAAKRVGEWTKEVLGGGRNGKL